MNQPNSGAEGRSRGVELSSWRKAIEQRSASILVALREGPRWLLPLLLVGLLLAGLAAPPIAGGVALLVLVAVLSWLAFLSWPALRFGARGLRVAAILLLGGLAVLRLLGRA